MPGGAEAAAARPGHLRGLQQRQGGATHAQPARQAHRALPHRALGRRAGLQGDDALDSTLTITRATS